MRRRKPLVTPCQIPPEILCLILAYEGGIVSAYRKDFIGTVYIDVYRSAFGWRAASYRFSQYEDYFVEMALQIHANKYKHKLKTRKCRKNMKPWKKAFGESNVDILMDQHGLARLAVKPERVKMPKGVLKMLLA
jgi:hypothetical protein